MIHPTAVVSPEARLGADVTVGPYSIVERGAEIGDGGVLLSHCVICTGTVLAARVTVHSFSVLGGPPQDLKFSESTPSGVRVGSGTVLRENVTISRATRPDGFTVIGRDCLLMGNAHVAHDSRLGDRVIMAQSAITGGHCEIGDFAFLGGVAALHQFVRIGEGVMIGGLSPITLDVPPFTMIADRNRLVGLNLVGLKRRGFARETIAELKALFAQVYDAANLRAAAAAALAAGAARTAEGRRFLEFFGGGKRGIARPDRGPREIAAEVE